MVEKGVIGWWRRRRRDEVSWQVPSGWSWRDAGVADDDDAAECFSGSGRLERGGVYMKTVPGGGGGDKKVRRHAFSCIYIAGTFSKGTLPSLHFQVGKKNQASVRLDFKIL